jgi:hypothetical protein
LFILVSTAALSQRHRLQQGSGNTVLPGDVNGTDGLAG